MFLSPVHILPVELLSRLFVLGAQDDDPYKHSPFLLKPDQHYYALPSTLFQLTVSHVCRHWRHVALRTPALWSTLCFREQSHIPRAIAYLARCAPSSARRLHILVDTVAPKDHVPGVTLCTDELDHIFNLIIPHVPFWRAFHLKVRDNACKLVARKFLGNAPPAPNLLTLQLYHFEDFRVAQDLYIATYRRPVRIFSNSLPGLRNVSLIGVNLQWDQSPYLHSLHTLELALHSDYTRPPYVYWHRMLRLSPNLQRLLLTYSGPRAENGTEDLAWVTPHQEEQQDSVDHYYDYYHDPKGKGKQKQSPPGTVLLESLWELSLTDLDPDYLVRILQRLVLPSITKLSLDLPDQDFTPFLELIAPPPPPSSTITADQLPPEDFGVTNSNTNSSNTSSPPLTLTLSSSINSDTTTNTTNSISDKSIPISGSPSHSSSTSPISNPLSHSNHTSQSGNSPYPGLPHSGPFPKISSTLDTLIITALECSWTTWRGMLLSLLNVQVLEVDFWKVCITGTAQPLPSPHTTSSSGDAEGEKKVAYAVLLEKGVLPRLKKCKISGVSGEGVKSLVEDRERRVLRGATDFGTGVAGRHAQGQIVEWSVVDDGKGDRVLKRVFERGVWFGVDKEGEGEGRWVKVRRIVEDDDEDEDEEDHAEEDEEEVDEEEEEVEQEQHEQAHYTHQTSVSLPIASSSKSGTNTTNATTIITSTSAANARSIRRGDVHRVLE